MRELRQCEAGGLFFLQCMWALSIHISRGGLFIAEHPAKPLDDSRPSIWTSSLVQTMLGLPDLVLHCVPQYKWGAESTKPTGLLAWNLPFFHSDLYKQACSDVVRPSLVAIGKDSNGEFRTSRLKEYPARFSFALAFVLARQLDRLWGGGCVQTESLPAPELESWIQAAACASAEIRASATWLPDFQDL